MPTVNRGLFRRLFQGGARLEDFADRLNHVWTSGLLLVLGAVISWKNNYSDPISCCAPAYFTQAHVNYAEKICWNMYTYSDFIPNEKIRLKPNFVKSYYQYVPLILCFQALLFKLPNVIMNILHSFSGVDFHKVNGLTDGYQHLPMAERQNLAIQIARYVYRWCTIFPCRLPWRLLTIFWFLVKIMYCINVINQMTYLDRFLNMTNVQGSNSASHGVAIYDNIMNNVSWAASPTFSRVIMCHFNISEMTIVRTYSFQCYLNNNPLTERVSMFLWVWILFVAVTTSLSSIVWVILTLLPISRQR